MTDETTEPRSFEDFEADASAPAPAAGDRENAGDADPPAIDDAEKAAAEPNAALATDAEGDPPSAVAPAEPANGLAGSPHDPNHWTALATTPAHAGQQAEATDPSPAGTGPDHAEDGAPPDPARFERGEADPAYIEARVRWVAGQEFEARQAQAARAARIAEIDQGWNSRILEAGELYPDFDDVVLNGADRGTYEISEPLALGIKASPVGPDIAYHLASNPAEASRLSRLPIPQAAYEFGKLEARMEAQAQSRRQPTAPVARPSRAPAPPATLARGAGGRFTVNAASPDFAAFEAAERARHR